MTTFLQKYLSPRTLLVLGYVLVGLSVLALVGIAVVPFGPWSGAQQAGIITALVVAGEVLFWAGAALLGPAFWPRIKAWFSRLVKPNPTADTSLRWFRLIVTPLVGIVLYVSLNLLSPLDSFWLYYGKIGYWNILYDVISSIVYALIFSEANIFISKRLDALRITWEEQPVRRATLQFLLALSMGVVVGTLVVILFDQVGDTINDGVIWAQLVVIGFLASVSITLIYVGIYFFQRWKTALLEAETLRRESAEARFEALKSQLDPHFLFNNLNTLTYLVEGNRPAVAFVENLSLVYRYILQNRDKALVPLADELKLADAYIALLKERFGDALDVAVHAAPDLRTHLLPPLTLQLLLENAVKHNVVDVARPLRITLMTDDNGTLRVENNLQKRASFVESPGIGLANIRHRYQLAAHVQPTVAETAERFTVTLPLIAP